MAPTWFTLSCAPRSWFSRGPPEQSDSYQAENQRREAGQLSFPVDRVDAQTSAVTVISRGKAKAEDGRGSRHCSARSRVQRVVDPQAIPLDWRDDSLSDSELDQV